MFAYNVGKQQYLHELQGLPEFLSKLPFEHLCEYNQRSWLQQEACHPEKKLLLPNLRASINGIYE